MTDMTLVEIVFLPDWLNHWLRFGEPDRAHDLDRRRSIALFGPGRLFGYVRWRANDYGRNGGSSSSGPSRRAAP